MMGLLSSALRRVPGRPAVACFCFTCCRVLSCPVVPPGATPPTPPSKIVGGTPPGAPRRGIGARKNDPATRVRRFYAARAPAKNPGIAPRGRFHRQNPRRTGARENSLVRLIRLFAKSSPHTTRTPTKKISAAAVHLLISRPHA